MDELRLTLLGNPEIGRDGATLAGLQAAKAQALLYYLAVTGRPHLRPSLVGLLWPDMPEASARNNLSKALTQLRQTVGDHLIITRQEVTFDRQSPYWLDVEHFERAVATQPGQLDIEALARAADLYRGDFLEGFYLRETLAFEEWMLAQRARLRALALQALHTLAAYYAGQGAAGAAAGIEVTTRLLALEPWREEAHRQRMALLARSGQRGAALAQYEACRQVLAAELGIEPGKETKRLYEQIRDGEVTLSSLPDARSLGQTVAPPDAPRSRQAQAHEQMLRGQSHQEQGEDARAQACFERAALLYRELGVREREASARVQLGSVCAFQGNHAQAQAELEHALQFYHETGMQWDKAAVLVLLGALYRDLGQFTRSLMHVYPALGIYRELGRQQGHEDRLTYLDDLFRYLDPPAVLRAAPQPTLEGASPHEPISGNARQNAIPDGDPSILLAIARSLLILGSVSRTRGRPNVADRILEDCCAICHSAGFVNELGIALALRGSQPPSLCRAIRIGIELGSIEPILYALPAFVWMLAKQGETELAIEVGALALKEYPKAYNTRWLGHITASSSRPHGIGFTLPRQVVAQARRRGRARDLWATAEELYAAWCE